MDTMTATPTLSGNFDFANVRPGNYVLAVKTLTGETLKEEHFYANGNSSELSIHLRDDKPKEPTAADATVGIRRLNHKVPKAARKALNRYANCREGGNEECAAKALDDAIAADPELLEAYVNRSAYHARNRHWDQAEADVEKSLSLDPQCSLAYANRAFVAVHRQQYEKARDAARTSLKIQPGNINAQYLLALAQLNLGAVDEGFGALERIAPEFEPARRTLDQAAPLRTKLVARAKAAAAVAKSVKIGSNESPRVSPKSALVGGSSAQPAVNGAAFAEGQRDLVLRGPASGPSRRQ